MLTARARRAILGLAPDEASFARRGFAETDPAVRERLERVGATFIEGYNIALAEPRALPLAEQLNEIESERRGWAFEGAAMALALLDTVMPWKRDRTRSFLEGPGRAHVYMVHVGIGWALARLRRKVGRLPSYVDPLLRWLVVDGYGFHEAYFNPEIFIERAEPSPRMQGYAERAFDHGVGRSLWFVDGADVGRISKRIEAFPKSRRSDLWSGIGLACAYAGGVGVATMEQLITASGTDLPHVRQGVAFAAKARERAVNSAAHTDLAARILCGVSARQAAQVCEVTMRQLSTESGERSYESWRQKIRLELEAPGAVG